MVRYLALVSTANTDAQLQCLTPSVMAWADTSWVMALENVLPYWQDVANRMPGTPSPPSLLSLWKRQLCQSCFPHLPPATTPLEWAQHPVQAVWAHHPFLALLMVSHMKHSKSFGWIVQGTAQFNHLWDCITWDTWEQCVKTCLTHWERRRPAGFTLTKTNQSIVRLLRLIRRLGLTKPADLHHLPPDGIRRRFGPWAAHICDWTRLTANDTRYFPWHQWREPVMIQCERHLDHPSHHWHELVQPLTLDLDLIAQRLTGGLTGFIWHIRFETDEWIPFPIQFRHPHLAQRELGKHPTILRQCHAALAQFNQRRLIRRMPRVTGWQLEVTGQLQLDPEKQTLFGFESDPSHDQALARLENTVLVPLYRFRRLAHWTPGEDWSIGLQPDSPWQAIHNGESQTSPLFFWRTPRRVTGGAPVRATGTLTTLKPWWRGTQAQWERWYSPHRLNGQWQWAYWDGTHWWSVGLYG